MSEESSSLGRWQAIASIIGSLAVPLILAVLGFYVQKGLSSADLQRGYVEIATGILKEDPEAQDKALRAWAVEILEKNSPVPFTQQLRNSLATEQVLIPVVRSPIAPEQCMEPPSELKFHEYFRSLIDGKVELDDKFIEMLLEESGKAYRNTSSLRCLQESIRSYQRIFGGRNTSEPTGLAEPQKMLPAKPAQSGPTS